MPMVDHERLARLLRDFARTLVSSYQVTDILYALCDSVVELLPVSGAGVMLEDAEVLRFVAASDEVVREIETLQIELGEGPCLRAFTTGDQVVVPDLRTDDSFPRFAPRALAAGMRGVYSFPMHVQHARVGALNFYSHDATRFDDADLEAGQVLADVATSYIVNARTLERSTKLSEQLRGALESRVLIEQAKGKLSAQLGLDVEEAFAVMRQHARLNGLKLRQVATDLVEDRLHLEVDERR
jgi:GAF domain-containing protein